MAADAENSMTVHDQYHVFLFFERSWFKASVYVIAWLGWPSRPRLSAAPSSSVIQNLLRQRLLNAESTSACQPNNASVCIGIAKKRYPS